MKKHRLIWRLGVTILISFTLINCRLMTQLSPTIEPTQATTETYTPDPTSTSTLLPTTTSTPTAVPTLVFYSVDPTLVATSASCSAVPDKYCVSGLTISLTGQKLDEYTVTVNWPGFSGTSFECPQQALLVDFGENMAPVICDSDRIVFVTVGLTEITITLDWHGGSTTQTLHPVFEIVAPEGSDCEPQCIMGVAEINIP